MGDEEEHKILGEPITNPYGVTPRPSPGAEEEGTEETTEGEETGEEETTEGEEGEEGEAE